MGLKNFLISSNTPNDPQSHDKCCTTFVSIQITIPILSTKEAVYSNGQLWKREQESVCPCFFVSYC